MEIQTETMTMEQAIEKGYTHFVQEQGTSVIKFSSINEENIKYYKEGKYFLVDMETIKYYSIDVDTIKDLIADYVSGQEEVADENDNLYNIAAEHDYSKIAEELNEKFKKQKYYEALDIHVTF